MSVSTTCDFSNRGNNTEEVSSTSNNHSDITGALGGGALVLDGSMTLTLDTDLMCDGDIQYTDISENFELLGKSTDRELAFDVLTPSWYIAMEYDINGVITVCDANNSDNCDDAFRINSTITFSKSGGVGTLCDYSLPNSSLDDLKLAQFNATDQRGAITRWDLLADMTLSGGSGTTEPSVTVEKLAIVNQSCDVDGTFSSVTGTCDEDVNFAQLVYWNDATTLASNPAQPTRATADTLSDELTYANMVASLDETLATVCDEIQGNTLSSWSMILSETGFDVSNNLSRFAHKRDKTTNDVFDTGDKVVLSSPAPYTVSITDYDDTKIVLANDYVYGVLIQKSA